MFDRRPTGLHAVITNASLSIAQLGALEGFSRSLMIGIVPLLALKALGSKEAVTQTYLLASILTLTITLNFATLERLLHRRWVLTLGGSFLIAGAMVLMLGDGFEFAIGIGLQSAAASLFSVCLSLYIMDYIGKKDLKYSESKRMTFNGAAWLVGPSLGIWLWNHTLAWTPFVLASVSASVMLAFFWYLRLGSDVIVKPAKRPAVNPFKIIPRYFEQPALRIAYSITLSRSIFWMTLFIYCPIYVVEAGLPDWVAGGMLSFVSGLLLASGLVRRLADKIGTRTTIISGLLLTALGIFALFLQNEARPIGLLFWILAAMGGAMLDVLGNIPFMRMVKPRERTEMTMIFSTWRETSQLVTPLVASLILLILPFRFYYLFLVLLLILVAYFASFLPRRL